MSQLLQDLRYSLRSLARTPGFALIAVLTLALGIGANSAIFSVINGVILKPLGYPEAHRLVMITSQFPTLGFDQFWVSPPEYWEFRERNQSFENVGAYTTFAVNLGDREQPMRVPSANITASLFATLGVDARIGRTFTAEEDLPNADPVVVLSDELWRSAFNADPSIVGTAIEVNATKRTVVGVMPPGFDIHDAGAQIWLPLGLDPAVRTNRGSHFLYLVGRLKPDISPEKAKVELEGLLGQWSQITPNTHTPDTKNHRLRFDMLKDDVVGNVRTALWVLQGAVFFVLLIACANMANLLLARAEARQKEIAIRTALGAARGRLLRQFLTEGVVLAVAGGLLGLGLAYAGVRALLAANPDSIPRAAEIGLDGAVVGVTLLLALGTGLIFGLAPLMHLGHRSMNLALKEGGDRSSTSGRARSRVRRGLVVAEVAFAVMLVVGAGLLLRSFWNLMQVDSGFDRSRLVTFGLVLPAAKYNDMQGRAVFFRELAAKLRELPGVEGAAAMSGLPPQRQVNANDTDFDGYAPTSEQPAENVDYYQMVTADYLPTMGIPVVEGRGFSSTDAAGSTPVAVVNQTLARTFFPGQSPVGRRVKPGFGDGLPWFTIIGVVKDVKQGGLDQKTGTEIYFHTEQLPAAVQFAPNNMNIVLRTTRSVPALAGSIRSAVRSMDPGLPIVDLRTMDEVFSDAVVRPRFLAQLLGIFAALALALAAVGTYGILSYMVTERRREIGIRMALGADVSEVMSLVLGQGFRVTLLGLALGVLGALALNRLAASLLFGVAPTDPLTFLAVSGFITAVALVACLVPARRATRVDPMVALRDE